MANLRPFLFDIVLLIAILPLGILVAARDAQRRDKSRLLVVLLTVFFFPIGTIAWLIFRPAPQADAPLQPRSLR
jgi:hypothetical protein